MNRSVSVLVLLLIAAGVAESRPQDDRQKIIKCPSTSSCTCIEYSEVEIQCPRFEPRIFVRIQPNNYIHFDCENSTNNEHELLPEFKLDEAGLVEFIRCPLMHGKSVTTYLKNIHINRIRSFQFVSSGANQHIPIESEHFKGLGDIERFDLRGMENEIKDLPADLFADMTKITWVRIRVANIQLPRDLFAPLVNLEFLELGHNKLKSLEPGFLRNQRKLKQLNLWGNSLRNLNKASFEGLDMVGELDLSGNGLEQLEPDVFFHLTNLSEINLSANNFASLPDGLFANNKKIYTFKLLENRITLETLPSGLLANLSELEKVYIKCDLKRIPGDVFKGSSNIKTITLSSNMLETLPQKVFADQSSLESLDLSGNFITELPDEVFLGTKSLKELRLSKNSLKVISNYLLKPLSKLESLHLENNQLARIEPKAFVGITSVTRIFLQNNRLTIGAPVETDVGGFLANLTSGSPFQKLEKLQELNLVNNSITTMFEDFTLMSLKNLNLSHNQISSLSTDELQSLQHEDLTIDFTHNRIEEFDYRSVADSSLPKISLLLNDNPIMCDCKILGLVRHLTSFNKKDDTNNIAVFVDNLRCAGPENMLNKLISNLNPMELVCPLDHEGSTKKLCPEGCSCLVRPEDKHLLITCDDSLDIDLLPVASAYSLNQTELKIESSSLMALPFTSSERFKDITKLLVSGNKITDITLDNLPPNVHVIELHNNSLQTLNETVIRFLRNSSIERLTLSNNPWRCDCSNWNFINFVHDRRDNISDYGQMKCSDDDREFNSLTKGAVCPEDNMFILVLSIATAVMGLLLGGLAALYYKYQKQIKMWMYAHNLFLWFVTEEELDKDKRYDAFVSYSHRDQDFVADYLLPELENGSMPYKLCVHERDWSPGLEISTQISNSVNDARRTIIVMSPNYLQSNWAQWEFRVAQSHAATEKRSRIIVILYGDIGDLNKLDPEIRDYLKLNTYVKWGDKWFWEKLKYAMPHMKGNEKVEKTKGLVKTAMKSSVDDKLELIKPVSVTPPQLTTPPAEKVANPLITSLNAKNAAQNGKVHSNGYNGHINGAFVINTSSRQSDV